MTRCTELVAIGISCGKQIPCPDHDAPTTAAHPQAPAEPWRSPGSSGERLTLHELLSRAAEGYRQLGGDLRAAAEHFREHPPEVAAPLREERDRLAEKLKDEKREGDGWWAKYKQAEAEVDKWEQEASEAKDVNRLATLRLCARELRAALSAPPRKAPQEGCKACALVAKEFGTDKCPWCGRPFGTTVGYVEKCSAMHHAVRSAMGLDKPAYDARPSSPEEQLSGKELKRELTPPDRKRCQAEITTYHPLIMGGNPHQTERCKNAPVVIATEKQPGKDGQRGKMSMCAACRTVFEKQQPGAATFKPLRQAPPATTKKEG